MGNWQVTIYRYKSCLEYFKNFGDNSIVAIGFGNHGTYRFNVHSITDSFINRYRVIVYNFLKASLN